MVIWYFWKLSRTLKLYKPKFSRTAIYLTLRNCSYMMRLGLASFIAEVAISCMMVTGNFEFMHYLHEDGVAAFSVACYLFPMIFMFGNAMSILGFLFAPQIVDIFIERPSDASSIGEAGVPLFLLACLPFTLNVVLIGYLQSMEAYRQATVFMLLRGFILIIPCFILLPKMMGVKGLWLAEPVSETLTLLILLGYLILSPSGRRTAEGI